jgi:HSP20 family protein
MNQYALDFYNPRFTSDIFSAIEKNFSQYFGGDADRKHLPSVDVRETADAYVLDMDLPGLTEKDVAIDLKDLVLSISVQKPENRDKQAESAGKWLIRERLTAAFSRHFSLPRDIDPQKIAAVFKNGVLTVTIQRREEAKSARIAITAE